MNYVATQAVNLPVTDYLTLELYLLGARPGQSPDAFVTDLVRRWLAAEMERQALRKNGPALRGFQWKNVFLPDGTVLRSRHGDRVEFAKVVGDRIVSDDGMAWTPSMLANRHGKGRNAWRCVWLRFPGSEFWVQAARCRSHSIAEPCRHTL